MSKDPLEELFGPIEPDDAAATQAFPAPAEAPTRAAAPAPAPVAARPAQRVSLTPQYSNEPPTAPVPEVKKRSGKALPWIIVGAVAVIALIVALVFVNNATGDTQETPAPTETTTEEPTTEPATETPSEEPSEEPETPTATEAPKVDVGGTYPLDISYAGISVLAPSKLNPNAWYVPGTGDEVMFHSTLMGTFPASCADMRSVEGKSPWGIKKDASGKWTVIRPATSCAAAPELYDEVWGLVQSIADSAKPLAAGDAQE